jgi:hypothetical protein
MQQPLAIAIILGLLVQTLVLLLVPILFPTLGRFRLLKHPLRSKWVRE